MMAYPYLYTAVLELAGVLGISYVLVDLAFAIIDLFL